MLPEMRNRAGRPSAALRALALVLVLLLGGPLTVLLFQALLRLAHALI